MGNAIFYDGVSDESDPDDIDPVDVPPLWHEQGAHMRVMRNRVAVPELLVLRPRSYSRQSKEMPVIRKKPNTSYLKHTSLYKEVKALCGLPANSKRPNERWSLERGLQKRENGMAAQPPGAFSENQQRRIANLFLPNQKEKRLMSLESKIFVCKFNKDGSRLITACQDAYVRLFDSSKGTYHRVSRIRATDVQWSILDIDFSPCGQYFAYSTWSDYFFVVPINGATEKCEWLSLNTRQPRAGVFCLRFSSCGKEIIGGSNNSCIYVCDRETRQVNFIEAQGYFFVDINAVSYLKENDSRVFVSGCDNGVIKLWDQRCLGTNRNKAVSEFVGHLDAITYIDPRNDGNYFLTNSKDQSIKIWDVRRPTPNDIFTESAHLPLLNWDYRWDSVPREYYNPTTTLEGDMSVMTYRGHRVSKSLLRAKFSPAEQTGQRYIYTGCATGRIIVYDLLTGLIKEAIEGHKDIVRDLSWHPVRSEIISSSWDTHVNLNAFKRNSLSKRPNREPLPGPPPRRSRRLAYLNDELNTLD